MLRRAVLVASLALVVSAPAVPASAEPSTRFQMPFSCSQAWTGATRSSHSPNPNSIDWNRTDDYLDPVVAAAGGIVTTAETSGSSGYGRHVVINHGRQEQSLYAHMETVYVVRGQRIEKGAIVGMVGSTGRSTGPHLHFEERQDGRTVPAYFNGRRFRYGSTPTSRSCPDVPLAGDFDGDRRSQLTLFRRYAAPRFAVFRPGRDPLVSGFGTPLGQPVIGDWDGDGRANVGQRGVPAATFALRTPRGIRSVPFGAPTDMAVAGDWDGDGRWQVGVRRPGNATFYLRRPSGKVTVVRLGDTDDLPVTGDWNGDRRTDVGVFDPRLTRWTLRWVARDGSVRVERVTWGRVGDRPVVGDWDGNRRADLGTWTPTTATFRKRRAPWATEPTRAVREVRFGQPE